MCIYNITFRLIICLFIYLDLWYFELTFATVVTLSLDSFFFFFFACVRPIVPAPFVKQIIFCPLYSFL